MKILLINPLNRRRIHYVTIPNLGLGYLASALREYGHPVDVIDCPRDDILPSLLPDRCNLENYDLIGFQIFSSAFNEIKKYSEIVFAINPQAIQIGGGPHPTALPQETLENLEHLHFAFRGEAEPGLPLLIRKLDSARAMGKPLSEEDQREIPGLVWRSHEPVTAKKDQIKYNPPDFLSDLDQNPWPAWDLLNPQSFPTAPNGIFSKNRNLAPMITTRGCPYLCSFCAASLNSGKKIRFRSVANIIEEMELLTKKYGIKEIHIMDDNFTFNRDFVISLCRRITEKKIQIDWACPNGVRIDSLDKEMLRAMEESGCYSLALGIESGVQRILDLMQKKSTLEAAITKIELIKSSTRIRTTGFFIFGYPGESAQDIEQTIDFARKSKLDKANFFNFTPFPGSEIFYRLKTQGELNNIDYDDLYIHSLAYSPPGIDLKRLRYLQRKAYFRFYLRIKILLNLLFEITSLSQLKIIFQRSLALLW